MSAKLVRNGICALALLLVSALLPTSAWADGQQCEIDPSACIDPPCDGIDCEDPDPGPEPDPDPESGCGGQKSAQSLESEQRAAVSRLNRAIARANRMEQRILGGTSGRVNVENILPIGATRFRVTASPIVQPNVSPKTANSSHPSTLDRQKAGASCPAPSRSACYAIALVKNVGARFVCAAEYTYRLQISEANYEYIRRANELLGECLATADLAYDVETEFCDAIPSP